MGLWQKPPRGALINPSHPLARGLDACWVFNESAGTQISDSVSRTTATFASVGTAPIWAPGGVRVFGDGSQISIPRRPSLEGIANISVRVIFERIGAQDAYSGLLCYALTGNPYNMFALRLDDVGDNVRGEISTAARVVTLGTSTIADSVIYDAVMVYNGATITLYCNGKLDNTPEAQTGNLGFGAASYKQFDFGVAGTTDGLNNLNGNIYHGAIWSRALSADEVGWLYREPYAMFQRRVPVRYFYLPTSGETLLINVHDCGSDRPVIFD